MSIKHLTGKPLVIDPRIDKILSKLSDEDKKEMIAILRKMFEAGQEQTGDAWANGYSHAMNPPVGYMNYKFEDFLADLNF